MRISSKIVIEALDEQHESLPVATPCNVWFSWFFQRDRLWLMLIASIMLMLLLSGCHVRSDSGCHSNVSCCDSSDANGALAVFYVVYLLGWIILSAAGN